MRVHVLFAAVFSLLMTQCGSILLKKKPGTNVNPISGHDEQHTENSINLRNSSDVNAEFELLRDLLRTYNKDVRPVRNVSHAVPVDMDIALAQILELAEKEEYFKVILWTRVYWMDEYLTWNPDHYEGLVDIRIPVDSLWAPDIVLYNSATDNFDVSGTTVVIVNYEGRVSWLSPVNTISQCSINIKYFPFDTQVCDFVFGSWAYTGRHLSLNNMRNEIDLDYYKENGEFDVASTGVTKVVKYYPCCPDPYPFLSFSVKIVRKPSFYVYNLILPCVVIVLAILLQFLLPSDSGEKIGYGTTLLLAMAVFSLIMVDNLPANSNSLPLASEFFVVMMMMTGISILMSMIVLYIHHRNNDQRLPACIRAIFLNKDSSRNVTIEIYRYLNNGFSVHGDVTLDSNIPVTIGNDSLQKISAEIKSPPREDIGENGDYSKEHIFVAQKLNIMFFFIFISAFIAYVVSVILRFQGY